MDERNSVESLACMITDWIRLHSVLLPLLITDLLYYLLCTFFSHPFIPVNAFLECCILVVSFFWSYYEKCTSTLITYFQFVYVLYFLYTSSFCCIQKEYIKINHISCVYFLCTHQVYIRYNRVDLCTQFVYKKCTQITSIVLYYETCTSTLITCFQFVSVVYFLYTSSFCCIQKEYIKINHISCVYFLCTHQVYIRYNGVDLCTLFVYKLCTNRLHIFVRVYN